MTSEITSDKQKLKCTNCRVVELFGTEAVACIEKLDCHWAIISGYGHFCKHPSTLQYSNSNSSRLFS